MNRKIGMVLSLFLSISSSSEAQVYKAINNGIKATVDSVDIEISFYGSSIVRILKSPKDNNFSKESLSVIKKPQPCQ